ncbi:hypothetical protein C8N40_105298 [Pontibacter mucosus]|uniref:Uncharacterized protein n=1 Tax=Pontibacter mucosus TaxID=1649266 RepID=A0A2T5YI80_9BACT|nr:hypothetical protein [Pontibacter mucosus]PTX19004.1 hypothetical protein C8N40_105298 [Pontibacter mucosus]
MPINIFIRETFEKVDWLCDGVWDLPTQIDTLETWLVRKGKDLAPNQYVADIGFDIRKDASGGGGVFKFQINGYNGNNRDGHLFFRISISGIAFIITDKVKLRV